MSIEDNVYSPMHWLWDIYWIIYWEKKPKKWTPIYILFQKNTHISIGTQKGTIRNDYNCVKIWIMGVKK
jgi:hypothetical protein